MKSYRSTIAACFVGYIVQAVINNFAPLLFLTFQSQYQLPISQITLLVSFNFLTQLAVDFAAIFFVDRSRAFFCSDRLDWSSRFSLMVSDPV